MRKRGLLTGLAAAALSAAAGSPEIVAAFGKTRSIALYNIHSKDTVSVVYKRDGKFVPEAMEKVNWALRDWRKNEPAKMDPDLVDLLWEIHTELGSKQPIHIISGFRSKDTNEMLRKTVGGQASESQHIQGKAADVHFPDVPLKQLRYSALIRERGGVGYYPTSAIPFVHVDTARVRHWPRLPRYELALLFPNGQSKHQPIDGGAITRDDVKIAQSRHKDLAVQVAQFFNFRSQPKPLLVADAGDQVRSPAAVTPLPKPLSVAAAEPVVRTVSQQALAAPPVTQPPTLKVAALTPLPSPQPKLVSAPRLIERPSRFSARPSEQDRGRLDELVTLASFAAEPKLVAEPKAVERPQRALASLSGPGMPLPQFMRPGSLASGQEARVAALSPVAIGGREEKLTDVVQPGWGNGYTSAPEFYEEHPDELSYRPFPVAPLLTASASPDDPVLSTLAAPDVARTLDLLDAEALVLPMRFHPGAQTAQLLWAQQFKGGAVNLGALGQGALGQGGPEVASGLSSRSVRTLPK
ncbi:MAG: DUF882 domain-containing protein [Hyphomicrobium sp.]